jgi:hypothetical protein
MDITEYRKRYETQLAKPIAADTEGPGLLTEEDFDSSIKKLLTTLRNESEPAEARKAALHALKTASFLGPNFAPYRADFLAALRDIAKPRTDAQLLEDALEVLAIEKDPLAQELLRRGLADPNAALVSPAKALQFLGYDDHAEVTGLAREAFRKATDHTTKEQALRLLASDPASAGLFASLLKDKSQPRAIRALSATGLNVLDPQAFAAVGRSIVTDDKDYEDIRATVLNALTLSADHQHLRHDPGFVERVKKFETNTSLRNLSSTAARFMKTPEN